MTTRPSLVRALTVSAAILLGGAAGAQAQIPDQFKNLQVLPKETSKPELVAEMRMFASSLGVRCGHCHSGGNPETLEGVDFASDEKDTKKVARQMMAMVREINGKLLAGIPTGRPARVTVRCGTCHHGVAIPRAIEEIVSDTLKAKGVEPAIAEYRDLREKNYGTHAYDFGERPLNFLGETLLRGGKLEEALALLNLNAEMNSKAVYTRVLIARALQQKGDKPAAIEAYKKVLELAPDNKMAAKAIEELEKPPAP